MLLQTMMIGYKKDLFKDSRIVFFAGGTFMSLMNGASKFIMDSVAFKKIKDYYLKFTKNNGEILNIPGGIKLSSELDSGFRAIIHPDISSELRNERMKRYRNRLMVTALLNDKIIPAEGINLAIKEGLKDNSFFRILHFDYPYMHENPFPVLYNKIENKVENAFKSVFQPISDFLR